jgi:serine/threonine protein kinase
VNENSSSHLTKLPSISALPVGVSLQEFEITGVLGEGGFGIVYLARDRLLGREVAIKEYMPASLAARGTDRGVVVRSRSHEQTFAAGLQSFISEARLLAQFKHPALVEIFRFWEQNGTAYMAMPFYRGPTLKQYLKANPQLVNEAWLRKLLLPLLDGLEHLHQANCFHRDIAPDNILILDNGQPLLLDFGAARRIVGEVTAGLTVILKPGYAPVEQYADDASIAQGAWTDVYGLAAICFFAVTGQVPPASVTRLMRDPMTPLASRPISGYSKQLLFGIDRGLSVKPENRPQSIAEFKTLLGFDVPLAPSDLVETQTVPTTIVVRPTPQQAVPSTVAATAASPVPQAKPAPPLDLLTPVSEKEGTSKRFPFLKSTEKRGETAIAPLAVDAASRVEYAQLQPAETVVDSKKRSTSRKKTSEKEAKRAAAEAMVAMDEDTVVLGSKPPPSPERSSEPTLVASEEANDSVVERKRSMALFIVAALGIAAVCIGLFVWLMSGSIYRSDENSLAGSVAKQDKDGAAKATPEPPSISTSPSDGSANSKMGGSTDIASADAVASQEKARADEQARLDAEKALADEKTKAEEKEKTRLAVSGTVVLNISPWGEVLVNGQSRGASPPRKRLSLVEGTYQLTIKNGMFEPFLTTVEVKRGQEYVVAHQFK